uniref:N-domain of Clp chaperone n=1 Tax=Vischeria sp. ACOI 3415 TaxID=2506143 RepID=A0A3R5U1A9_9STRA|nr:N-domain of Clp chaperone [Vischeria sp. ACOI 3415]QAA12111.1 N-domain of Clp chaperone [Vischeria sp. ACOI 3415]
MIAKKMVMSKNIKLLNKRLLSVQLKKALLYAFLEAKKNKTTIIDSQLLLYGILKVNSSLANKLIRQIYKSKSPSFNSMDSIDNLLVKLKLNIHIKNKIISTQSVYPNFSKPVKQLLFFLLRSGGDPQTKVITSLHVLKYLLCQKNICILVKDGLRIF